MSLHTSQLTKLSLLSIALPLALLTPACVPLTQGQEQSIDADQPIVVDQRFRTNPNRVPVTHDPSSSQDAAGLAEQGSQQIESGEYEAALQSYQAALALYRQNGDRVGQARALRDIGLIYTSLNQTQTAIELGQYQQAIEYYQQALSASRAAGDRLIEGDVLNNLGSAYRTLEQYQQAEQYYQQALATYRSIGARDGEEGVMFNLNQMKLQQAGDCLEQAC